MAIVSYEANLHYLWGAEIANFMLVEKMRIPTESVIVLFLFLFLLLLLLISMARSHRSNQQSFEHFFNQFQIYFSSATVCELCNKKVIVILLLSTYFKVFAITHTQHVQLYFLFFRIKFVININHLITTTKKRIKLFCIKMLI